MGELHTDLEPYAPCPYQYSRVNSVNLSFQQFFQTGHNLQQMLMTSAYSAKSTVFSLECQTTRRIIVMRFPTSHLNLTINLVLLGRQSMTLLLLSTLAQMLSIFTNQDFDFDQCPYVYTWFQSGNEMTFDNEIFQMISHIHSSVEQWKTAND